MRIAAAPIPAVDSVKTKADISRGAWMVYGVGASAKYSHLDYTHSLGNVPFKKRHLLRLAFVGWFSINDCKNQKHIFFVAHTTYF
jgi:hypothetical protein